MNIGIIIGISEYTLKQDNLPGCKKDAELMYSVLNKTGKFDEILYLNETLSSANVKEKLTSFISENKSKKIEELVFYYTGHGEFMNDEFYYILSDFNESKRKQTSLQNNEIDSLIKTLSPDLVVKVIDACQSGKAYIKEANIIEKHFKKSQDKFNKCYFLNSSLKDQSSFQSDIISDFTLSLVKSIQEHDSSEIRYKDIIDYISDEFENNTNQTPFFVIQADYTEKFCTINSALNDYLKNLDFTKPIIETEKIGEISLVEKVKIAAADYFTKEQAIELITAIKSDIEGFKCSEQLNEIFDLKITFSENYDSIIDKNTIGKWLDDNDHEYFAKSNHSRERKDRYTNPLGSMRSVQLAVTGGIYGDTEYEWVRNGFEIEVEVPYKTIIFNLISKYPNIDSHTCRIIYFLSKRKIRFFYFITNFVTKNWDEKSLNKSIEWLSSEYKIKNKETIVEGLRKIVESLETKVLKQIEEKFNKKPTSAE